MLGAQHVDTAELYPDEAVEFDYFLDQLEIGQDMTRAGVRAKQSLLRDYTGVLRSLVQKQLKRMPGYSAVQVPTLLDSLYEDGDARGLPIRDDAPPQLKVAMVKFMVTQEAERERHPSGEFAYLAHYVHQFRKIAKEEKQAAAAA